MKRILFLLSLLFAPLFASEEEIVVYLRTQKILAPLYLDKIADRNSGFPASYLSQLEKVLRFDLDHNGRTHTMAPAKEFTDQCAKEKKWNAFEKKAWQLKQVEYVIKGEISEKKFSVGVFSVKDNSIKGIESVALTGNLNEDRRKVHQVSDSIHETFFGSKGIAQSHILYTLRTRKTGQASNEWQTEVWEADYDGANAHQVTQEGALCVTPTYLPGRGHSSGFFYVSYRIGQPKIFAASLKEGKGKRLSYLQGNQLMPTLAPSKDLVAFICDATGNPDLFIQPFSFEKGLMGKPRLLFTAKHGTQGSPTFSPDGKRIAFVSNKDGTPRIYILAIPTAGTPVASLKPQLISKQNRDNTGPVWSYDGKKIAYAALTKGVRQIWIYDVAAGKEMQLTDGSTHKENPTWASDSLHLIFNSSTDTSSELYLINLNQKESVKISQGAGEKRFPSWEPLSA